MTIAQTSVSVSAHDWESLKATFMLLSNMSDDQIAFEVCEEAIARMESMQQQTCNQTIPGD